MRKTLKTQHILSLSFFQNLIAWGEEEGGGGWNKNVLGGKFLKN